MGTVDADTLCGLPCSYYLDYENLVNVPDTQIPGTDTAQPGSILTVDENGDYQWTTNPQVFFSSIDGGSATTNHSLSERYIDGVAANTVYLPQQLLSGGMA